MLNTPEKIERELIRIANRGIEAAAAYLRERIQIKMSVPAPTKRIIGRNGVSRLVATTRATPGAPPRKITGTLRGKVTTKQISDILAQVGVFADVRARPLETWMNHPYLINTLHEERGNLMRIVGNEFRAERVT